MKLTKRIFTLVLCFLLAQFTAQAASGPISQSQTQPNQDTQAPPAQQSTQELQQLVAPIALYPDALVAQILAASMYPDEIVEADRWMQNNQNLKGDQLAKEVDKQPWDPSVKAMTQFPAVLENMDKNLSWTSSLGDAYANQQQEVTDAVQTMRQQAQKAGHLSSNQQEKVTTQGNTIVIEPSNPEVVYVPAYDPWMVYGYPIVAYPGWYPVPGIFMAGVGIGFGIGFGVGFFGGYGWGWHHWGYDWHGHRAMYNHNTYISHSRTIVNRNNYGHSNFNHNNFNHGNVNHNNAGHNSFNQGNFNHGNVNHGNAGHNNGFNGGGSTAFHAQPNTHSGAFSGFDHGGNTRGFSSRGRSSFGGGGGGGGFHAGGFGGGGSHGGGGGHGGGGHH